MSRDWILALLIIFIFVFICLFFSFFALWIIRDCLEGEKLAKKYSDTLAAEIDEGLAQYDLRETHHAQFVVFKFLDRSLGNNSYGRAVFRAARTKITTDLDDFDIALEYSKDCNTPIVVLKRISYSTTLSQVTDMPDV